MKVTEALNPFHILITRLHDPFYSDFSLEDFLELLEKALNTSDNG
jgi:hypothetical protein